MDSPAAGSELEMADTGCTSGWVLMALLGPPSLLMSLGEQGDKAPCPCVLTGVEPPIVGSSSHGLIAHIAVVDQVLHQGVHVAWSKEEKGG